MSNENRIENGIDNRIGNGIGNRIESDIEDIYTERARYLLNTDDILEDILKKGYT